MYLVFTRMPGESFTESFTVPLPGETFFVAVFVLRISSAS